MKADKLEKQIGAIGSSKKFGCYRVYRMSDKEFNVDDLRAHGHINEDFFVLRSATARQVAEFILAYK